MDEMHLSAKKEQFSLAYVGAVAAASGYSVHKPSVDNESIDLGISARTAGAIRSPRLELQIKCTSLTPEPEYIGFDLKKKNYDDLRHTNLLVPRILVVVLVPGDVNDWIDHDERCLVLKHCGYWVSLLGLPEKANRRSVAVRLPRRQLFSPTGLQELMALIAGGGRP